MRLFLFFRGFFIIIISSIIFCVSDITFIGSAIIGSITFGGVDVNHFTKDMVLREVSEYQIFRFYCGNFVDVNKLFCSEYDLKSSA